MPIRHIKPVHHAALAEKRGILREIADREIGLLRTFLKRNEL
jgi:hypothetical protein